MKQAQLTNAEKNVFLLRRRGMSLQETADILDISRKTVQNHVRSMYRKFGVRSIAELGEIYDRNSS